MDPRQVPIYRPYPDEVPWSLLPDGFAAPDLNLMRIAKVEGEVIGVYVVDKVSALHHRIQALAVARGRRGQGLGRWLAGHAIGICESKGARLISAPPAASKLFLHLGFQPIAGGYQLALLPE